MFLEQEKLNTIDQSFEASKTNGDSPETEFNMEISLESKRKICSYFRNVWTIQNRDGIQIRFQNIQKRRSKPKPSMTSISEKTRNILHQQSGPSRFDDRSGTEYGTVRMTIVNINHLERPTCFVIFGVILEKSHLNVISVLLVSLKSLILFGINT